MEFSSIREAATALNSRDSATRLRAAEYLYDHSKQAAAVVPELIAGLDDSERLVICYCAKALAMIGPAANEAVTRLARLLRDANADETDRNAAAEALGCIGESAVATLNDGLGEDDDFVRQNCANALSHIGPSAAAAMPMLIKVLNDPVEMVRYNARQALEAIGPHAIPALTAAVETSDPLRCAQAGCVLLKLERRSPVAIRRMGTMLTDDNALVRAAAAEALTNAGDEAETVLDQMIDALLNDSYYLVRSKMASALCEMDPPPRKAKVSLMASALRDPSELARYWSVQALGRIHPLLPDVVRLLTSILENDPDVGVRLAAARCLGDCGSSAKKALRALRRILEREDNEDLRLELQASIVAIVRGDRE
jgi:HEAT repeat protein